MHSNLLVAQAAIKALKLSLGGDGARAALRKLGRVKPLDEPLLKSHIDELGGYTVEQHAAAAVCIAKANGLAPAIASIKTQIEYQRRGGFYTTPMSKADAATPPAPQLQGVTQPKPIPAADPFRHQNRAVNPADPAATHNQQLKETANAHADAMDAMRAALSRPTAGPVPDRSAS